MRILYALFAAALLSPLFSATHDKSDELTFFKPCNPQYYVGVGAFSLDSFTLQITDTDSEERSNALSSTSLTNDIDDPGVGFWGVFGYQLNKMLACEFAYRQLVWKTKWHKTGTYTPDPLGESYNYEERHSYTYFGPSLLISFPFNCYFAPYVKTGMIFRYHKQSTSNNAGAPLDVNNTIKHWKIDYAQGFGLRADLTESFNVRLEYDIPFFDNQTGYFGLIACYGF